MTPEERARQQIDLLLQQSGWIFHDRSLVNFPPGPGAIREAVLKTGEADYLLFAGGKAIATVEAKPEGYTLTGVEEQSGKYAKGLLDIYPSWGDPLPFAYESTGAETRFTNRLDPNPASRGVFAFHRPETLIEWATQSTPLNKRLQEMPPLVIGDLWQAQIEAIQNLEKSLAENRPRALIQMATGSGKTFTAVNFVYRLIKHAGACRVLFLVDRGNLGDQTLKEFQQFVTPDDGRKFTELYNVQHLQSAQIDTVSRVTISTIQRLYSMLQGKELDPELDEVSGEAIASIFRDPLPVTYNPKVPIETFDFIVTDECHRSIYNLWRQVLEYFDSYLIGLTATPNKQTFGFFQQNLVQEYGHERAVADGVNVNYDVYQIRTEITQSGSQVDKGFLIDKRHRQTRKVRWMQLDEDLTYASGELDRAVVAPDQIRTVIRTFRDLLFTEIFPGRTTVPKTLIFAKDDSHAEDIVKIVREEFGKGNDFCQKITYRTTGAKPQDLIQKFRNSYDPRIAVTVDMIATGTDIKPLEIVMFMRSVKSRGFFEQMKGRGVRVISDTEFQQVTPDAKTKTHFVIVDAVGVCERDKSDSRPLEQKKSVPLDKLMEGIALGVREPDALSSLAGRLIRLEKRLDPELRGDVEKLAGGKTLSQIAQNLLDAIDPDYIEARAKEGKPEAYERTEDELGNLQTSVTNSAVAPIATNPELRQKLIELQQAAEQTIDTISKDKLTFATEAELARQEGRSYETGEQLLARVIKERCEHCDAPQLAKLLAAGKARKDAESKARISTAAVPTGSASKTKALPQGWADSSLDQLCLRFVDSAHRTPRYGTTGIPALGPRDVVDGRLNLEDARLVSEEEFRIQTKRHIPQSGDVIYSRELSLGWAVELPPDMQVCLSQGMCLFRIHPDVATRYFLIVLNGPLGRQQAEQAATGSAHPHINLSEIKRYFIPLPPLGEQRRIVEEVERRLSVIEELEVAVAANLQRAGRLRQSLLRDAFSGRLAKFLPSGLPRS